MIFLLSSEAEWVVDNSNLRYAIINFIPELLPFCS